MYTYEDAGLVDGGPSTQPAAPGAPTSGTGTNQPARPRPAIDPSKLLPPSFTPSASSTNPQAVAAPTGQGGVTGNTGVQGGAENPGSGGSLHGPGEVWTMGPGQGCKAGYVEQQRADGTWTCIPQSDFDKIFKGDFSPLFKGNAPEGVTPVGEDSIVTAGGKTGTALDMAKADGYVPPSASSSTQGPTSGDSGAGAASGSDSAINRLIDLAAAQFAGAGAGGGGSGFDGLVSGPLATASETAPAAGGGSKGLVVVILLVAAGVGFYFWHKHHKGKASA